MSGVVQPLATEDRSPLTFDYGVYGGCLRSDTELSNLPPTAGEEPDWRLRTVDRLPAAAVTLLGEATVVGDVRVRLYRTARGYRLEYDDTGVYDISADGTRIDWLRPPDVSFEAAEMDIGGRVLATALHAAGVLCLHGSGVAFPDAAIGLLAPKHHGKSTLAQALVAAGAKLVTDDVLPVEPDSTPHVRPGTQRLRLWADSAERLAAGLISTGITPGGKYYVDRLPVADLATTRCPLAAIYLLAPSDAAPAAMVVERQRLGATEALLALLRNATLGPLLGGSEAPRLLEQASRLADAVPVYRLRFTRGYDRLPELVRRMAAWHTGRVVPAATP
jgi:hypothetical protein